MTETNAARNMHEIASVIDAFTVKLRTALEKVDLSEYEQEYAEIHRRKVSHDAAAWDDLAIRSGVRAMHDATASLETVAGTFEAMLSEVESRAFQAATG